MFPGYRRGLGFWTWIFLWLCLVLLPTAPALAHASDDSLLKFYRKHISAIDGNRCPMTPSCSEYARQAMEKHGPILGWIITCDRLMRCGRSEKKTAPLVQTKDGARYSDPLEDNDSWWFFSHEASR